MPTFLPQFAVGLLALAVMGGARSPAAAAPETAPATQPAPPADPALAGRGSLDLGLRLYQERIKELPKDNLCLSPWSLYVALAMLADGAKGASAAELGELLKAKPDDQGRWLALHASVGAVGQGLLDGAGATPERSKAVEDEVAQLTAQLVALKKRRYGVRQTPEARHADEKQAQELTDRIHALRGEQNRYAWSSANALFGEKTWEFVPAYVDRMTRLYGTGAAVNLNFKGDPEGSRRHINAWGAERTRDRIKEVLPPGSVDRNWRLAIANAVHFKGEWATPFDVGRTLERPFHNANGKDVPVRLMEHEDIQVPYAAVQADGALHKIPDEVPAGDRTTGYPKDGFHLVELPYKGEQLSMVLAMPVEGKDLAPLEKLMTAERLTDWLAALAPRKSTVAMPRFKIEGGSQDLTACLAKMGLKAVMDPVKADFTGLCDHVLRTGDPRDNLFLGGAFQQTFIEVNEKGTEAAAVTVLALRGTFGLPETVPFHPEFRADRPFIYLLRDRKSGAVLFIGRVVGM